MTWGGKRVAAAPLARPAVEPLAWGVTVQVLFKSVKIAFAVGAPQRAQRGGGS